jgi:KaiC/GvpD/RAD55 family RecA-like ATPase
MPGRGVGEKGIYSMDELLGGGIVIPNNIIEARVGTPDSPPEYATPGIVVLLTGAPGSGKSTFALELCSRLATADNSGLHPRFAKGVSSLYLAAEVSAKSLIQNAQSFGWNADTLKEMEKPAISLREQKNRVFIYGRNLIRENQVNPKVFVDHILKISSDYFPFDIKVEKPKAFMPFHGTDYNRPEILVIDSLNTLGADAVAAFREILSECASHYMLTVAILDTGPGISPDHHWDPREYLADMEIDFSYDRPENYMIRRIWVVKARFQDHADGFHRMKINPKPTPTAIPNPLTPLIKEGGIFVFPSVHRHLSVTRKDIENKAAPAPPTQKLAIATPFSALDRAIQGGGFPGGGVLDYRRRPGRNEEPSDVLYTHEVLDRTPHRTSSHHIAA